MKKLAIAIIITAVAVQAADYKFPGWKCADVPALQEQLALAPSILEKVRIAIVLDVAENGMPDDFSALCERIDVVITSIPPETLAAARVDFKKQFVSNSGKFRDELMAYCWATPSPYDLHIMRTMQGEQYFARLSDCLLQYKYSPNRTKEVIGIVNQQGILLGKSTEEMSGLLERLNRVYSAYLVQDKEAWGNVVAQIRTLMEAYK